MASLLGHLLRKRRHKCVDLLGLLAVCDAIRNAEGVGGMLDAGPDQSGWNDEPEEVTQEVVHPEVKEFWARVDNALVVVVEHAGGIVQDDTVELAGGDDDLKWVAEWVAGGDHGCNDEAEWSPHELGRRSAYVSSGRRSRCQARQLTAVMVSMQSTNGSEVRYLESEKAYSFHSWPNRSCFGPIDLWLTEKYPSKNKWMHPAVGIVSYLSF